MKRPIVNVPAEGAARLVKAGGSLDDLLGALQDGDIYVNVHTNDGIGDINTGPGDFPGGEIRGQFRLRRR
jgi:hypothetical protein